MVRQEQITMKQRIPDELLEVVKLTMDAGSVVIIACDSPIPCPDELAGDDCKGGHYTACASTGIALENLSDFIQAAADNVTNSI